MQNSTFACAHSPQCATGRPGPVPGTSMGARCSERRCCSLESRAHRIEKCSMSQTNWPTPRPREAPPRQGEPQPKAHDMSPATSGGLRTAHLYAHRSATCHRHSRPAPGTSMGAGARRGTVAATDMSLPHRNMQHEPEDWSSPRPSVYSPRQGEPRPRAYELIQDNQRGRSTAHLHAHCPRSA